MRRSRHTAEQIIGRLREAEVLQGKGMSIEETVSAAVRSSSSGSSSPDHS